MSSNNINSNHTNRSSSSLVYDKDKINFIAAICHHVDIIFSIITVVVFFHHDQLDLAGVALTLVLLDRIGQFLINGVKTYKWSKALMSLVYLDYFLEICTSQEGRGMQLFKKKYAHALLVSSPFAVLCFFGYFELTQHHGLILACGFIHAVNTIQSNLEYYSLNIVTITITQRIYIYMFCYCEFFYRLVFLSYFKQLSGKGGIAGYLTGMFFVNVLCEFIVCKREGQEKNYWVGAVLQKGWCGVFYFRLEDIMVQDADEWNEDNKNQDNHRQSTRLQNSFKSARSKMFIILRLLENLFLTIIGIAEFADDSSNVALFVLVIILLPIYLFWHVKYTRFSYANAHSDTNRMGIQGNNDSVIADKYKDNNIDENNHINEEIGQLAPQVPPKQQKIQQQQLRAAGNPKQDQEQDAIATYDTQLKPMQTPLKSANNHKYTAENDGEIHQSSEQTYAGNSDSKKFNNLQQERSLSNTENKPMNSRQYSGTYGKSKKSTTNKNDANINGFNADLGYEEKSLNSNTKDKKTKILNTNNNNHKQSYEEDEEESYGKGNNVNAFAIE